MNSIEYPAHGDVVSADFDLTVIDRYARRADGSIYGGSQSFRLDCHNCRQTVGEFGSAEAATEAATDHERVGCDDGSHDGDNCPLGIGHYCEGCERPDGPMWVAGDFTEWCGACVAVMPGSAKQAHGIH
jgi:hypothetical protein